LSIACTSPLTWYQLYLILPFCCISRRIAMADSHSSSSSVHSSNPFAFPSPGAPPSAATIAVLNIHGHVPVTLDMDEANFRQWRTLFELTFKKFALTSHIDGSLDAVLMQHDPEWLQIDACIVSWLYSTISKPLMFLRLRRLDQHHRTLPRQQSSPRRLPATGLPQPVSGRHERRGVLRSTAPISSLLLGSPSSS